MIRRFGWEQALFERSCRRREGSRDHCHPHYRSSAGAHTSDGFRDFKSSKVANERSKMHEKADLREANLNGAILADAKLGGAPRRGILLRHLHRAASDIVTTSDVTP
jgi:hypothetical protein